MKIRAKRSLAVTSIMCTITASIAVSVNSQASEPVQNDDCACAVVDSGCGDCCDAGCIGGHGGGCAGACSMPPHYMYFPQSHGNYYFRPYNYQTILYQQQAVARYGGDRRNPYDNSLFEELYESSSTREDLLIPEPESVSRRLRPRQQARMTILREPVSLPSQVHIDLSPMKRVTSRSSSSAYRVQLTSEAD